VRVSQAVHASAALPGVFEPATITGRSYIDGGLGSPTNADLVAAAGMDRPPLGLVIVSAPLSIRGISGLMPVASAVRSVPRRRLRAEIRQIRAGGTQTLVFEPGRSVSRAMGLNPMSHHRIRSILNASDKLTHHRLAALDTPVLQLLEDAGRLLPSPPAMSYPVAEFS